MAERCDARLVSDDDSVVIEISAVRAILSRDAQGQEKGCENRTVLTQKRYLAIKSEKVRCVAMHSGSGSKVFRNRNRAFGCSLDLFVVLIMNAILAHVNQGRVPGCECIASVELHTPS